MPEAPPVAEGVVNSIAAFIQEEGMQIVGNTKILGNVPCVKCKLVDNCELSGVKMLYGPEATVDSIGINNFEDQEIPLEAAKELGRNIAESLNSKK